MKLDQALTFLAEHAPLPPADRLSTEHADAYAAALVVVEASPDPRAVPVLLRLLAADSDEALAQTVARTLARQEQAAVWRALGDQLGSTDPTARTWAAHVAIDCAGEPLVEPLRRLLLDEATPPGAVHSAVTALEVIRDDQGSAAAGAAIREAYEDNPRWSAVRARTERAEGAMATLRMEQAVREAEPAWAAKDFPAVIGLLEPHEGRLPTVAAHRLAFARRKAAAR